MIRIRFANRNDAEGILAIYAPYIKESSVTFEYEVEEAAKFCEKIEHVLEDYPWLVAEKNGIIIGYAYATRHRDRSAYQWCAESSIYVHSDYAGNRVGSILYETLHEILIKQNIVNLYAGIAQPNEPSTMFHIRMGFTPVGVYKKVGYKNGQWHDVVWVHKTLIKHNDHPAPPVKFSDAALAPVVQQILDKKTAELNNNSKQTI